MAAKMSVKSKLSETESERGSPNEQSEGHPCTIAPENHAADRDPSKGTPWRDIFKELLFQYLALPGAGRYAGFYTCLSSLSPQSAQGAGGGCKTKDEEILKKQRPLPFPHILPTAASNPEALNWRH